jgi:hypothetical protein
MCRYEFEVVLHPRAAGYYHGDAPLHQALPKRQRTSRHQSLRDAHPKFSHESTVNQFFNEAPFESYRNLGSWEFGSIVEEFSPDSPAPGNDIKTLFDFVS